MTNFEMIQEFCEVFGASHEPALWRKLIREETEELDSAIASNDAIEEFDAICDLLYVTYGYAVSRGFPADLGYAEVHRSNMTKLGPDGKPLYREDGKIMKGPDYEPPNLKAILDGSLRR